MEVRGWLISLKMQQKCSLNNSIGAGFARKQYAISDASGFAEVVDRGCLSRDVLLAPVKLGVGGCCCAILPLFNLCSIVNGL